MYKLALLFSMLFVMTVTASVEKKPALTFEEVELQNLLFNKQSESNFYAQNNLEVMEIEEEIDLGFNTKDYLPENFNPLQGKADIDWSTNDIVELDEEIYLDFNTDNYLPKAFNPLEGKGDIDWSTIELVELEEELELDFDTKAYLPENFNVNQGKDCKKEVVMCL